MSSPEGLERWRAVLAIVRVKRPALASVLEHAALLRFDPERVDLGYETGSFLVGQATDASAREILLLALAAHFGKAPLLGFETIAAKSGNVTLAMIETAERKNKLDAAKRAVAEHPLVSAAIELLGAELRDVRLADADSP
jgi:DNA polymerase-3 subunit gamma/tau